MHHARHDDGLHLYTFHYRARVHLAYGIDNEARSPAHVRVDGGLRHDSDHDHVPMPEKWETDMDESVHARYSGGGALRCHRTHCHVHDSGVYPHVGSIRDVRRNVR